MGDNPPDEVNPTTVILAKELHKKRCGCRRRWAWSDYEQATRLLSQKDDLVRFQFNVNGYDFGDNLLKDVIFTVTVDHAAKKVVSFVPKDPSDLYLKELDMNHWLTVGRDYATKLIDRVYASDYPVATFTYLNPDGTLKS